MVRASYFPHPTHPFFPHAYIPVSQVTALFYLSDVKAGGGTGFSNLKMEVQAETGKLLVFHNCYEGTCQVHPDSVHAGLPVIEGDKWAVRPHIHAPFQSAARARANV